MPASLAAHVMRNYRPLLERRNVETTAVMRAQAQMIQADMKAHHPWKNQTGDAEKGLFAQARTLRAAALQEWTITAGHGVDYGVFLEQRWAARFAIVGPTMLRYSRLVIAAVYAARARIR